MTKDKKWWQFWKQGTRYWKVCDNKDANGCSNKHTALRHGNHSLKKYEEEIMHPPKTFRDLKDGKVGTWEVALAKSCRQPGK